MAQLVRLALAVTLPAIALAGCAGMVNTNAAADQDYALQRADTDKASAALVAQKASIGVERIYTCVHAQRTPIGDDGRPQFHPFFLEFTPATPRVGFLFNDGDPDSYKFPETTYYNGQDPTGMTGTVYQGSVTAKASQFVGLYPYKHSNGRETPLIRWGYIIETKLPSGAASTTTYVSGVFNPEDKLYCRAEKFDTASNNLQAGCFFRKTSEPTTTDGQLEIGAYCGPSIKAALKTKLVDTGYK